MDKNDCVWWLTGTSRQQKGAKTSTENPEAQATKVLIGNLRYYFTCSNLRSEFYSIHRKATSKLKPVNIVISYKCA